MNDLMTLFLLQQCLHKETPEEKAEREKRDKEKELIALMSLKALNTFISNNNLEKVNEDELKIGDTIYASYFDPCEISDLKSFKVNMILNNCFDTGKAIIVTDENTSFSIPKYLNDSSVIYRKK